MSINRGSSFFMFLVTLAAVVAIVAGMRAATTLLVPFLLAAFIAVILAPPLQWLQRNGVSAPIALLMVVTLLVVLSVPLSSAVGRSINSFGRRLAALPALLDTKAEKAWDSLFEQLSTEQSETTTDTNHTAASKPVDSVAAGGDREAAPAGRNGADEDEASPLPESESPIDSFASGIDSDLAPAGTAAAEQHVNRPLPESDMPFDLESATSQLLTRLVSGMANIFSNTIVIAVTVIFMLLEAARFPAKLRAALGRTHPAVTNAQQVLEDIRRYMLIKTLTSALTGVLVAGFLWVTGIEYALLLGLLAFLLNYVPNIGSIIAAIPAVLLALFGDGGLAAATITAIGFAVINFAISYGLEPRFMGQGLGLSTLIVFMSLVFWGWVLGPVGMLLSAPLTMIVKIVLENFEDTRWIAQLMSAKAVGESGAAMPATGG